MSSVTPLSPPKKNQPETENLRCHLKRSKGPVEMGDRPPERMSHFLVVTEMLHKQIMKIINQNISMHLYIKASTHFLHIL